MKFLDVLIGMLTLAVLYLISSSHTLNEKQIQTQERIAGLEARMAFSMPHTAPEAEVLQPRTIPTQMVSYTPPVAASDLNQGIDSLSLGEDLATPAAAWKADMDELKAKVEDLAKQVELLQVQCKANAVAKTAAVGDSWNPDGCGCGCDNCNCGTSAGFGSSGVSVSPVVSRVVSTSPVVTYSSGGSNGGFSQGYGQPVYSQPTYSTPTRTVQTVRQVSSPQRVGLFGRVRSGGGGFFSGRAATQSCPGGQCPL